jgi:REP element-mobilizing transposase RayT
MRNPLKRHYGQGDLHFITFSCYRRRPLLGTAGARDQFVKILEEVRRRHEFRLVGYVVMPEHVRLLLSEPAKKNPSKILQVLKQKVARALLKKRRRPSSAQFSLPFEGRQTERGTFGRGAVGRTTRGRGSRLWMDSEQGKNAEEGISRTRQNPHP